jgi:hypothetical protein
MTVEKKVLPAYGPDIILLAGAGASTLLGYSSLDAFLRRATQSSPDDEITSIILDTRRSIEADPQRATGAIFEELVARLKEYLRVGTLLRLDPCIRRVIGQLPQEVNNGTFEWKWKQALSRCYRALLEEYGPSRVNTGSAEFKLVVEVLVRLCGLNSGHLHVYTTNYDCSYQVLASACEELTLLTHIDNTNGKFSDYWSYSRPECQDRGLPEVFIHRLHGCIAWFTGDEGKASEVFGAGKSLHVWDDDVLHRMCIKLVSSQQIGSNAAFQCAFEEFSEHLVQAKALLIWGISFRDMEVLRAINSAFYARPAPLPVYYVNPFIDPYDALGRIQRTLAPAPIALSPQFIPKQIDCLPQHFESQLVDRMISTLEKEV